MTDDPDRPPGRRRDAAWALGLGAAAIGWSSVGFWVPSIWADEGATLSATQRDWPELLVLLDRIDAVHGLYYALLKIWFAVFGADPVTLRLFSLLAVGVLVGLSFLLARTWLPRPWAVLAAAGVATLPRTTWMAIEGRSWALVAAVAVAATLLLVRALDSGRRSWWVGYAAVLAFGFNLNVYLLFLASAHGVSLLWLRPGRRRLLRWLAGVAVAAVAAVPVVLTTYRERAQLGDREPLTVLDWLRDVAVKQFSIGDTPGEATVWVPRPLWSTTAVVLAIGCWLLIGLVLVRLVWPGGRPVSAGGGTVPAAEEEPSPRRNRNRPLVAWCLPWVVVPPALALLASLTTGGNVYHPRYFGFTVAGFAILVSAGVRELPRWWLRVVAFVVLVALTVPVHLSQRDVNSKAGYDWSQAARVIGDGSSAGEGVHFGSSPPTRQISIAYPQSFDGLVDVSLLRTPAADGSLSGANSPLTAELLRTAPNRVWASWSLRSQEQAADLDAFAAAGYRVTNRWTGTQTIVVLLER